MSSISPTNPYSYESVPVLDTAMSYIDTGGDGTAFVFLHGNPTTSYLWRNVIPHVEPLGRCVAPDLPGFGTSGPMHSGTYRFPEFIHHVDAWFDAVLPSEPVILVVHDWGAALGFNWARRNPDRVLGVCYGEAMVQPRKMTDLPEAYREGFIKMRTEEGFQKAVEANHFVQNVFPNGIIRTLTDEEFNEYSKRFVTEADIVASVQAPREIPFDGEPADNHDIVQAYADFMAGSPMPKLFINTTAGHALVGRNVDFCRRWSNQEEVLVLSLIHI